MSPRTEIGEAGVFRMALGPIARRVLGKRLFHRISPHYRRIFVDLSEVARTLDDHIPVGAHVLDVGGGDGACLNALLERRTDLSATLIDLSPTIGDSLAIDIRLRVKLLPKTSMRRFLADPERSRFQVVLISDVLHHVPSSDRAEFFSDLHHLIDSASPAILVVKDVETFGLRANWSFLADRYISGDRNVRLLSRQEVIGHVQTHCDARTVVETALYETDAPNYSLVFAALRTS
ncbi:MAG: class I SAM-dependent methyltransferase [Candidatus Dormibacteria bacterium]